MESSYGIKTNNRFLFEFDNVGDPDEILSSVVTQAKEKKPQKGSKKSKKQQEPVKKEPEPELKPRKEGEF